MALKAIFVAVTFKLRTTIATELCLLGLDDRHFLHGAETTEIAKHAERNHAFLLGLAGQSKPPASNSLLLTTQIQN